MTKIVVTAIKTLTLLPAGVSFGSTQATVTDNSGAQLPPITLNGSETPTPWQASVTGAPGTSEASVSFQDVDTTGAPIGSPVVVTESGSGGEEPTFEATTGGTITVS